MKYAAFLGSLTLALLAGCVAPPSGPPNYSEAPPAIVEASGPSTTQSAYFAVPHGQLVEWLINLPLEQVFDTVAGLPKVAGTQNLTPHWGKVGSRRRVALSDGHFAAEDILVVRPGEGFRYQVWGFTGAARLVAAYAIGEFRVRPENGGTRVNWTYTFTPHNAAARLPLYAFMRKQWEPFMARAMENMKRLAEAERLARI